MGALREHDAVSLRFKQLREVEAARRPPSWGRTRGGPGRCAPRSQHLTATGASSPPQAAPCPAQGTGSGAPNPAGGAGMALGPTLPVALGGFASHLLPPLGPLCLPVTLTVMLGLTFHLTQRAFGDVSWQKTSSCSGDPAGDGHRPREERGLRAAAGGSCLPPGPGRSALVSSAAVAGFPVPAIHCHLRFADKGNEAQRC